MTPCSELLEPCCIPSKNIKLDEEFSNFINKMPSTISNDLYPKIKRSLFIRYAKLLGCSFVFTAETTTTLASNLLSNLALGRGSQVQNDVVSIDFYNKDLWYCRKYIKLDTILIVRSVVLNLTCHVSSRPMLWAHNDFSTRSILDPQYESTDWDIIFVNLKCW